MYKTTVFIIVFISLSIVTVGARLIWDRGLKRSVAPIDLQNDIALDSLANIRWPVYKGPNEAGPTDVRAGEEKVGSSNGIQGRHFYGARSVHNDAEFNTHLGSISNSKISQSFDVDATQRYIASFLDRPSMDRTSGGSWSRHGGGSALNRSGGGGSGGKGIPGNVNDPAPETDDVADGRNSEIPDWVYSPYDNPKPGDVPDDFVKSPFMVVDSVNPVPEPAAMLLFGAGLASLAGYSLRRKKSQS